MRSSTLPVALALVDDYHFADVSVWRDATKAIGPTGALSVFRVHVEYECDLLAGEDLRNVQVSANQSTAPDG